MDEKLESSMAQLELQFDEIVDAANRLCDEYRIPPLRSSSPSFGARRSIVAVVSEWNRIACIVARWGQHGTSSWMSGTS